METKLKMSDMTLSLDRCIKIASDMSGMCADKIKLARSSRSKRTAKQSQEFYQAVVYHLNRLKEKENECG